MLQAVLLVDTRLPGVCRNIIMFLAFGQTKLRSSIKLKHNRRKGNEKALIVGSHQPYFYRKQGEEKRGVKKARSELGEALSLWKNIYPSLCTIIFPLPHQCSLTHYQPLSISHWDNLPREVVESPTLDTFKMCLNRVLGQLV